MVLAFTNVQAYNYGTSSGDDEENERAGRRVSVNIVDRAGVRLLKTAEHENMGGEGWGLAFNSTF